MSRLAALLDDGSFAGPRAPLPLTPRQVAILRAVGAGDESEDHGDAHQAAVLGRLETASIYEDQQVVDELAALAVAGLVETDLCSCDHATAYTLTGRGEAALEVADATTTEATR